MSKTLNLYKVQYEGWRNAEYSAAHNQIEAITNMADDYPDIIPNRCFVMYVGKVYINKNLTAPDYDLHPLGWIQETFNEEFDNGEAND